MRLTGPSVPRDLSTQTAVKLVTHLQLVSMLRLPEDVLEVFFLPHTEKAVWKGEVL